MSAPSTGVAESAAASAADDTGADAGVAGGVDASGVALTAAGTEDGLWAEDDDPAQFDRELARAKDEFAAHIDFTLALRMNDVRLRLDARAPALRRDHEPLDRAPRRGVGRRPAPRR